jgi:hypothetical protein
MALGMCGLGYSAQRLLAAQARKVGEEQLADEDLQKAEVASYTASSAVHKRTPIFAVAPSSEDAEPAPPSSAVDVAGCPKQARTVVSGSRAQKDQVENVAAEKLNTAYGPLISCGFVTG